MTRLLHTGDLGDIIASLPILRSLGGGEIVISESKHRDRGRSPRESMRGARYEAIKPLLEAQPYVHSVEWQDEPTGITHDLRHFRTLATFPRETLIDWQARYLGVKVNLDPWLTVPDPFTSGSGYSVVARSPRYHNYFFPWAELVRKVTDAFFVGLPSEHAAFCDVVQKPIPYQPTKDLLELAQFIAGAKLFIGNQSCPYWLAAGLGVPLIQESWEHDLNSLVPRENAIYTPTPAETRTLMLRLYPKKKKLLDARAVA